MALSPIARDASYLVALANKHYGVWLDFDCLTDYFCDKARAGDGSLELHIKDDHIIRVDSNGVVSGECHWIIHEVLLRLHWKMRSVYDIAWFIFNNRYFDSVRINKKCVESVDEVANYIRSSNHKIEIEFIKDYDNYYDESYCLDYDLKSGSFIVSEYDDMDELSQAIPFDFHVLKLRLMDVTYAKHASVIQAAWRGYAARKKYRYNPYTSLGRYLVLKDFENLMHTP